PTVDRRASAATPTDLIRSPVFPRLDPFLDIDRTTGRNSSHLTGRAAPGDLAVWDGHVAKVVGDRIMIEARYQCGCSRATVCRRRRSCPLAAFSASATAAPC